DHCVQGTEGASLSKDLAIPHAGLVIRTGFNKNVDSYSAFTEADGKTTTGLAAYLKARKVTRVFVAGRATDFCVARRALDARKPGLAEHEAGLHDLNHRPRRNGRIGHFVHRLLEVGIELLARWIELLDAVLLQRVEQRTLGQFDALDEGLDAGIGGLPGFGRNGVDRA